MKWVLIIMLAYGSASSGAPAVATQEFEREILCETAAIRVLTARPNPNMDVSAFCVPKGGE